MSENLKNNVNELEQTIVATISELNQHREMFSQITVSFKNAVENLEGQNTANDQEMGRLDNEIKLLESKSGQAEKEIETLETKRNELKPRSEQQEQQMKDLEEKTNSFTNQLNGLKMKNDDLESKIQSGETNLGEKRLQKEELDKSINTKVEENEKKLQEEKDKSAVIKAKYAVWDYLKTKLENPEIEIMAIIAREGKITTEDLKKQTSGTISAVFIGRSISKLEADGKIIAEAESTWSISPALLTSISD